LGEKLNPKVTKEDDLGLSYRGFSRQYEKILRGARTKTLVL